MVGGYYDAGDNVKYGFPMAFTVTTLAWAAYFYKMEIVAAGEYETVIEGIRWGTDYFLKASTKPNRLFVQVINRLFVCFSGMKMIWFSYVHCGFRIFLSSFWFRMFSSFMKNN